LRRGTLGGPARTIEGAVGALELLRNQRELPVDVLAPGCAGVLRAERIAEAGEGRLCLLEQGHLPLEPVDRRCRSRPRA
jgi:hypothetical protein